MKQPKTIIKYLVNDPRICFEMTVSVSSQFTQSRSPRPRVFQQQLGRNRNSRVPRTGGEVSARRGAGMRRVKRDRGWRRMQLPGEGKEKARLQLLLSQGLRLLGIIGREFSVRGEEKGRKSKFKREKNALGTAEPGKPGFLPHLANARRDGELTALHAPEGPDRGRNIPRSRPLRCARGCPLPSVSLGLFWGGFAGEDQTPGLRSVLSFFPQQKDFILYNLTLIFKSPELCFFCLLGLVAFTALSSEGCLPGKLIARLVLFSRRSLASGEAGQS